MEGDYNGLQTPKMKGVKKGPTRCWEKKVGLDDEQKTQERKRLKGGNGGKGRKATKYAL